MPQRTALPMSFPIQCHTCYNNALQKVRKACNVKISREKSYQSKRKFSILGRNINHRAIFVSSFNSNDKHTRRKSDSDDHITKGPWSHLNMYHLTGPQRRCMVPIVSPRMCH